jgi:hypothetical protein
MHMHDDINKKLHLTAWQEVEKDAWHQIYPIFPWTQTHLLKWHLIWHKKERQPYHIGWLVAGRTLQELEQHLHDQWGFGNHFVAWTDTGQVLSWRKFESFDFQYHLRVFEDGEIRGHHEYTPESKPISHFAEMGEEPNLADFKKFLGDFVVDTPSQFHLTPDVHTAPDSELTIDEGLKN